MRKFVSTTRKAEGVIDGHQSLDYVYDSARSDRFSSFAGRGFEDSVTCVTFGREMI